jgi:hypothetical protein
MATQRLTVATLAGDTASAVLARFEAWRADPDPDPDAVDHIAAALRDNALSLPVVFFSEWVDRWLMGDRLPGPGAVAGRRFEATCFTPAEAMAWAGRCGRQHPEEAWLAARLREAAAAWELVAGPRVVVVLREAVGGSTTDEEVQESLQGVPAWLASLLGPPG